MLHRIKSNTDVDTFSMFIIALCDKVLAEKAKEEQTKREGQTQPPPIYTTHHDKLGHLTEKGKSNKLVGSSFPSLKSKYYSTKFFIL